MKSSHLFLIAACCLMLQLPIMAQSRKIHERRNDRQVDGIVSAGQEVAVSFAQNQILITHMEEQEFDKILVFNMQGSLVLKQNVKNTNATLDLFPFDEGVYLLVLRSSKQNGEKTIKFVVRK